MYDHYVALDWAQRNMAVARMTKESSTVKSMDVPSSVKELRLYLSNLKGKKVLTFEETSTSQWLYTELREYVDDVGCFFLLPSFPWTLPSTTCFILARILLNGLY